MTEYFIVARSYAAPFVSNTSHSYVEAESPVEALKQLKSEYQGRFGLYFAGCWASSDAKNKGIKALAEYRSACLLALDRATDGLDAYGYRSIDGSSFEINGAVYTYDRKAEGEFFDFQEPAA